MTSLHLDTLATHAGRDDLASLGVHALPLDLSTTYPVLDQLAGAADLAAFAGGDVVEANPIYARLHNPTVARFESALAALEHAPAAVAYASGMAAVTAVLLGVRLRGRSHVVAVRPLYGGTDHLLASGLLGVEATFVAADDVAGAIRPDTGLVMVETPANPTLALLDIADIARQAGDVPVCVDNTFATPVLQNPLDHGAAMALHSATKYLGGHGDVVGGVVATTEEHARVLRQVRVATGALLHPLGGYLLHRGLATLPARVERAQAGAQKLAGRLAEHPAVATVHYPGFDGDPLGVLGRQQRGPGAMLAFETDADPVALMRALRIVTPAVSLGSTDSLIEHPASLTHGIVDPAARAATGISPRLLRLSVGLEDADDLWADLEQALRVASAR